MQRINPSHHRGGLTRGALALMIGSVALFGAAAWAFADEGTDLFEKQVRPLLAEKCQKCHGEQKQQAGLQLDSCAAILTGGESGPAIVVGKPDDSELVRRITSDDNDERMPPPNSSPKLSDKQIAFLKRWIELGAPWPASQVSSAEEKERRWREHFAFQPLGSVTPPAVNEASQAITPVDQFLLAKLESAGLSMTPAVDRRTLIRRATYDLWGIPPTVAEVAAFEADTEPNAYEKLIDRLLASPRYGEQWGRYWLDLARYSDTKGYVYGREDRNNVHSTHYRDWVIRAFNDDLPYDRFVLLQIAADQAAPDQPEQLAALGFLTLGKRLLGVTPDIIDDRIDVVGRGLLGLTVGCARCHNHKFDPIPTADYYSLYGVFDSCAEYQVPLPRDPNVREAPKPLRKELEKAQQALAEGLATESAALNGRTRAKVKDYLLAQRHLDDYPDLGVVPTNDKGDTQPAFVWQWNTYLREAARRNDPVFVAWQAYSALADDQFSNGAGEVAQRLVADPSKMNPRIAAAFATPPATIEEVAERYARVFADIEISWQKQLADAKTSNQTPPIEMANADDEALRRVLYGKHAPCAVPEEPIVNTEYFWDLKTVEKLWKLQAAVDSVLMRDRMAIPYARVLTDRDQLVEPRIFKRGMPSNKGDFIPRQFLGLIAPEKRQPFQHGSGRLELAQAIASPTNTLTPRVWVNRVWMHHFGTGIVATPSDFGVHSSPPSHPELLDWLASQLIEHGWSTKWLHREIMLSAAYRQGSSGPSNAETLAKADTLDPDNRLLWRMNSRRLTFEQFRDTLLTLSGELDLRMGGRAVDWLGFRRSVYATVDREFVPDMLRVFDFPNPDTHASQRAETTTPQQALYALNNPYVVARAKKIAARVEAESDSLLGRAVRAYQLVLQRNPTPKETDEAVAFLRQSVDAPEQKFAEQGKSWSYGYGEYDKEAKKLRSFNPLPFFSDTAWQGGRQWPDKRLGWVQLTAQGGHAGDDEQHAAIRRWTASAAGTASIQSDVYHQLSDGDGIRAWIVSSRHGLLKSAAVHNTRKRLDVESIEVEPGDTIDFIVDRADNLNSDMFLWVPTITETPHGPGAMHDETWNSQDDFPRVLLAPCEQLVQVLLVSNELMFVD